MRERTITAVTPIEDTDWGEVECMSSNENMDAVCTRTASKEIAMEYEDEPDKTFYSCLCTECATEYGDKHAN